MLAAHTAVGPAFRDNFLDTSFLADGSTRSALLHGGARGSKGARGGIWGRDAEGASSQYGGRLCDGGSRRQHPGLPRCHAGRARGSGAAVMPAPRAGREVRRQRRGAATLRKPQIAPHVIFQRMRAVETHYGPARMDGLNYLAIPSEGLHSWHPQGLLRRDRWGSLGIGRATVSTPYLRDSHSLLRGTRC